MKYILLLLCNIIAVLNYTQEKIASVKNMKDFLEEYPSTKVIQCTSSYNFNYEPFPLRKIYSEHLWYNQGVFQDMFILEVENGIAYVNPEQKENNKYHYFLFINDIFIKECAHYYFAPRELSLPNYIEIKEIKGKVAIAHHIWGPEYGHFMLDVLSSLALLEIYNIEYDYLLIPYNCQFMKEVLNLWGIDQSKIIAIENNIPIKADSLIFPTANGIMIDKSPQGFGAYHVDFLVQHIRKKLLAGINKLNLSIPTSPKIFLSKKDTVMGGRNIPNEDEVFALFEPLGYQRYEFSKMSITEKIYRASKATHFISSIGAGCLHAIFMQPKGYYFEIQTTYPESTFCYLAQNVNLKYQCLDCTVYYDLLYNNWLTPGKDLSIYYLQDYIKKHPEL